MAVGMQETAFYAWRSAERAVMTFIVANVSGSVENTNAFLGELPKAIPSVDDSAIWMFAVTGINGPDVRPRPFWRFKGMIEGLFTARIEAQRFAGKILNLMPIVSSVDGLIRANIADVDLQRTLREIDEDQESGGAARVWRLVIEIEVDAVNNSAEL